METSFPKSNRLLTSRQYQSVFRNPKKFFSESFLVLSAPNGLNHSRLGLIVKKKNVKRAVRRNTLKRVVRESFRTHSGIVSVGVDMVVVVHKLLPKKQLAAFLDHQWKNILRYYRKS